MIELTKRLQELGCGEHTGLAGGDFCASCKHGPTGCCDSNQCHVEGQVLPEGIVEPHNRRGCKWWDCGCVLPREHRPPICKFYTCRWLREHLGLAADDVACLEKLERADTIRYSLGEWGHCYPLHRSFIHVDRRDSIDTVRRQIARNLATIRCLMSVDMSVLIPDHPLWDAMCKYGGGYSGAADYADLLLDIRRELDNSGGILLDYSKGGMLI